MKNSKTLTLVEGAVMVALATVLSFIRVYKLPWGGSITLLSMLPIAVFSIKHGVAKGLGAAFVFSLIQFIQGITDGLVLDLGCGTGTMTEILAEAGSLPAYSLTILQPTQFSVWQEFSERKAQWAG